jgi:hypothetical protein
VDSVVRSDAFAQTSALLAGAQRGLRARVDGIARRGWHLINLPAGTDVQRLRQQVGALDREVRLLTLELRRARGREVGRDGDDSESDQHD